MAKRRLGIVILLLCFCLCALPCTALAVSTADAEESINTEQTCTLTIGYCYDGNGFQNQSVTLYKIAEVSADFQYTLTPSFASSGLVLNGIQSNSEWDVVRSTLEAFILVNDVEAVLSTVTDETGNASFAALKPGLYLASAVEVVQEELTCCFDSALIALPGLAADGYWQYQIDVTAKPEILPPIEPDETMELKVLKLWKGDQGQTDRPNQIDVSIFQNGKEYETVVLSEENNWSYTWSAKADGADWKVVEQNIPSGYTMTVEQRENTFIVTNIRQNQSDSPPPKTGDTSNLLFYVIMMYLSGTMLVILAVAEKRMRHEKTKET